VFDEMGTAHISRWARRFLVVSAGFLLLSQVAVAAGEPRGVVVTLGLYGFVATTVFGKAYSLIPAYFDRQLAWARAPQVQLPLTAVGVLALAGAHWRGGWELLEMLGALSWAGGVAVFLVVVGVTVRDNPTGEETGTGESSAEREPLDRFANRFVPVALAYLAAATYELCAAVTPLPALLDGAGVRIAHLLGPGFAVLALFAVGYRLLPRFFVDTPSRRLARVVLPAGAVAPALLAVGYPAGTLFRTGALLESLAVVGFAITISGLFVRTDRDRVGFYGPLTGTVLGCFGVGLGLYFAFDGISANLADVHLRLNVFGLLGVSIVGVVYQFYPPAVAAHRGANDDTALASIAGLAGGLALAAAGTVVAPPVAVVGEVVAVAAAGLYCYILLATIRTQT
jgi:hypothetical protein